MGDGIFLGSGLDPTVEVVRALPRLDIAVAVKDGV